ncbi:hypothetical protein MLD38_027858 [Melastoma candidum]|uniref:Uncharacterized protein n=1 Tax=Melastoma candidum TaxID=119954 RepID=A0ACB9MZ49_9MYRT|nr:hypothetical protein MLD38_027858 [Melastoma candidum]
MARKGKNAKGSRRGPGKGSGMGESSNSVLRETGNSMQEPIVVEDDEEFVEEVIWQNPNQHQEDDEAPPLNLRLRAMQKGKLPIPPKDSESEDAEENFKSCNSDIEVTDDTACTLFPDGSCIAHKEAGLLLGVVDRVGERVKLEWRHTYRSVWVRRVNKWTCYPKPGFLDDPLDGNGVPAKSTDLGIPTVPFRKRVRDWFVRETRERKRMRWLRRIVRHRGMRKVKEVGVQADFEMDHEGTGRSTGQPGHQEDSGSVEVALCPGPGIMGAGMELSDEELMDWGPGAWYCRDVDPARCFPIARAAFEGSTPCVRIPSERVVPKDFNLRQLAEKFLHDLAEEEDQIARILKCQALRLIAGHLPGTSLEFREIISELTLTTRINVNCERFVSFERGIGEMQQWDRFNDESMVRFRTQVALEASLNRMNERISSLLLRTELCASRPLKLALKRCFKAWKVAARLRIEELRFHIQGWERIMIKMEGLMYERMLPRSTNLNFVLQDDQEESEEVVVSPVETAPLSFKEAIELTTLTAGDHSLLHLPPQWFERLW